MTPDPIRAALERLVELDDGCTADHWHAAITAARAALDAATEGQPSDQEIADVFSQGCRDLSRSYEPPFLGGARAIFARWGRPAAPPAPLEGEPSDQELRDLWSWSSGQDQGPWPTQYHCFARAIFARWGRPAAPPAPLEGEVGEVVEWLHAKGREGLECGLEFAQENGRQLTRAATLLQQLSAAAPAVAPDGPAVPESREPASVTLEATGSRPLSAAAQAVLDAFTDAACGSTYELRLGIAAVLRAVADQVVPEHPMVVPGGRSYEAAWSLTVQDGIRADILAIAAELEGADG